MSSTRRAEHDGPISQSRYMSSPEYAELHGLSGTAVAAKAAITEQKEARELLWFLQGISLSDGGLKRLAADLFDMFPERLVPNAAVIWRPRTEPDDAPMSPDEKQADFRQTVLGPDRDVNQAPTIEQFLIGLCIDPSIQLQVPSEGNRRGASLAYFRDIVGALTEYKRRHEQAVNERFQLTAIGRKVWDTLDFALKGRSMVLIDGREGRGKTEATKAWCQAHLGEARFVSLKGISNKTAAFREMAKALGIASSYTRKASEMQSRIEDVLDRSKLMLCLDEAHWLFAQSARIYTSPEMVDWIVTALCNRSVPVGLITTPQFLQCMGRAIKQVEWNHLQFQRRVGRRVKLPLYNTVPDLEAVTRRVFPKADAATVKCILAHIEVSERDISVLGDIVREVRHMLSPHDPDKIDLTKTRVTFAHIERVFNEHLDPSANSFAQDLGAVLKKQPIRTPDRAMAETHPEGVPMDRLKEETGSHLNFNPARVPSLAETACD